MDGRGWRNARNIRRHIYACQSNELRGGGWARISQIDRLSLLIRTVGCLDAMIRYSLVFVLLFHFRRFGFISAALFAHV